MVIAVALVILWRLPIDGQKFFGLEYEDSYVYTVAARQMLDGHRFASSNHFLTTVCVVGSISRCDQADTYSGHYIGSSYVFSLVGRLFGYAPDIGIVTGMVAACCSVVMICFIAAMFSGQMVGVLASAAALAMTPVFAVNGVGASAEPLSNLCVAVVLLAYCRFLHGDDPKRGHVAEIAIVMSILFSLLFAIVVKRENLLLAIALPAIFDCVDAYMPRLPDDVEASRYITCDKWPRHSVLLDLIEIWNGDRK